MKAIRHTGIVVTDMEKAFRFYRDLLGLKPIVDFMEKGEYIDTVLAERGVHVRMVKLVADDDGMIELVYREGTGRNPAWYYWFIRPSGESNKWMEVAYTSGSPMEMEWCEQLPEKDEDDEDDE